MLKMVKLAWRNMWRNWRRTLIASVAIVLSMILLIFFQAFMDGIDQAIYGNTVRLYGGNVLIHAPGYREKASRLPMLPVADVEAVLAAVRSAAQCPGRLQTDQHRRADQQPGCLARRQHHRHRACNRSAHQSGGGEHGCGPLFDARRWRQYRHWAGVGRSSQVYPSATAFLYWGGAKMNRCANGR